MINECFNYLVDRKERINRFLPLFLASYMTLLILPYVWGRVDVMNSFFSQGVSQIIYRSLVMVYGLTYLSLVWVVNKIRIKNYYFIGAAILVTLYIVSSIIGPHDIYYLDGRFAIHIKWWWRLFDLVKYMIAIAYFILIMNVIHPIMKSKKDLNISLFILVAINIFAVIFSFVVEYDSIRSLFNGADEHAIALSSIYQSKNTFGLFIFLSSLATAYLIFNNINNLKYYPLYFVLILFTFMAIIVGCRTALVACLLMIAYLFIRSFITLKSLSNKSFYISLGVISGITLLFILFMSIPSLHNGSLKGLYFVITYNFSRFNNAFEGRVAIWETVPSFMNNWHYLLFGANNSNSQYMLKIYSNFQDFHNGYLLWFSVTGIIGTIIYTALFIYIFYLIVRLMKKKTMDAILVLILLLSSMLYCLTESTLLFISTSLFTFVTNLVIVVYLNYSLKEE